MRAAVLRSLLPVAAVAASTAAAWAQTPAASLPGRIEVSGGAQWVGRAAFGSKSATEPTSTGGSYTLFDLTSELAAAPTVEATMAIRVRRAIDVEASGTYSRPELRVRIVRDVETANAPLTVASTIDQFAIGGAAVWYPRQQGLKPPLFPFLRAGVSYLRQLENGGAFVASGTSFEAGGGVKWLVATRARRRMKGYGVRFDARAIVRRHGAALDGGTHVSPAAGASVFLRF